MVQQIFTEHGKNTRKGLVIHPTITGLVNTSVFVQVSSILLTWPWVV